MSIPKDPYMLLSYINTKLRDDGGNLDELCASSGIDKFALIDQLGSLGFKYDVNTNQFK